MKTIRISTVLCMTILMILSFWGLNFAEDKIQKDFNPIIIDADIGNWLNKKDPNDLGESRINTRRSPSPSSKNDGPKEVRIIEVHKGLSKFQNTQVKSPIKDE